MLELKNITKLFDNKVILKNLNLQVGIGEAIQISGPSGAGKTTLLRCIAGLEKFENGSIKLNNQVIQSEKVYLQPHKRKMSMVFQDLALWPHMTVWQNIDFVSSSIFTNKSEQKKWNDEIINSFKIDHKKKKYPSELSGGEQQRVALARALANKPQILLLDEPFSHLDSALIEEIIAELEEYINNTEITLISVSHNPFEFNSIDQQFKLLEHNVLQ